MTGSLGRQVRKQRSLPWSGKAFRGEGVFRGSAQGVVGQYDEEPENADLGDIQPGEAAGAFVVFHGAVGAGSTEGEVCQHEEHAEDASVYQVEPGEGYGAAAAGGGSVHRWSVLDGCLSSMARIFTGVARSGSVIAQAAVVGEQVADRPLIGP